MKSILLIADTIGWIFHRHCEEIKRRMTEYSIDIKFTWQNPPREYDYTKYDLIYQLDPMGIPELNPPKSKTIIGLRNEFMYDHSRDGLIAFYRNQFESKCCMFHVVNKNQYKEFGSIPLTIPLILAQHGVDTSIFKTNDKKSPIGLQPLIVGISGNPNSHGDKGFELVAEACRQTGCQLLTCSQNLSGTHFTKEQMSEYYNNIDVYCCMSKTEGLNNCVMEAGATAVPVITTRTGAVEEMIEDGKNGFIIERNTHSLVEKLTFFRENREAVSSFGNNFMKTINLSWSWDEKIKDFRRMFGRFFSSTKS